MSELTLYKAKDHVIVDIGVIFAVSEFVEDIRDSARFSRALKEFENSISINDRLVELLDTFVQKDEIAQLATQKISPGLFFDYANAIRKSGRADEFVAAAKKEDAVLEADPWIVNFIKTYLFLNVLSEELRPAEPAKALPPSRAKVRRAYESPPPSTDCFRKR